MRKILAAAFVIASLALTGCATSYSSKGLATGDKLVDTGTIEIIAKTAIPYSAQRKLVERANAEYALRLQLSGSGFGGPTTFSYPTGGDGYMVSVRGKSGGMHLVKQLAEYGEFKRGDAVHVVRVEDEIDGPVTRIKHVD